MLEWVLHRLQRALRQGADGWKRTERLGTQNRRGTRSRHQHDHAGRADGDSPIGRLAAARCGACPAAVCHRNSFCSHPGSRHLAAPLAALVRSGLSPGLAATLLSLGRVLADWPANACHRATPRDAGWPRARAALEADLIALPSAPADWVMPKYPWPAVAADSPMAGGPDASGNLQALLGPYADWLRGASWPPRMRWRKVRCNPAGDHHRGPVLGEGRSVRRSHAGHGAAPRRCTAAEALEAAGGALRSVAYGVVGTACSPSGPDGDRGPYRRRAGPVALGFLALLLAISQIGRMLLPLLWGGAAWWLFQPGRTGMGHLHARLGPHPRIGQRQLRPAMADQPRGRRCR